VFVARDWFSSDGTNHAVVFASLYTMSTVLRNFAPLLFAANVGVSVIGDTFGTYATSVAATTKSTVESKLSLAEGDMKYWEIVEYSAPRPPHLLAITDTSAVSLSSGDVKVYQAAGTCDCAAMRFAGPDGYDTLAHETLSVSSDDVFGYEHYINTNAKLNSDGFIHSALFASANPRVLDVFSVSNSTATTTFLHSGVSTTFPSSATVVQNARHTFGAAPFVFVSSSENEIVHDISGATLLGYSRRPTLPVMVLTRNFIEWGKGFPYD
jgi:hypothetical protein